MFKRPDLPQAKANSYIFYDEKGFERITELYIAQRDAFWLPDETLKDRAKDRAGFNKLPLVIRRTVAGTLALFAVADGFIVENLANIAPPSEEMPIACVDRFLAIQSVLESIHQETYKKLFDTIPQLAKLQNDDIFSLPGVMEMKQFLRSSTASYAAKLISALCFEGIFFTGSFAIIYWIGSLTVGSKQNIMPSLVLANEFIARDENLHACFTAALYNCLRDDMKLDKVTASAMIKEACEIANIFTDNILIFKKDKLAEVCADTAVADEIKPLDAEDMRTYNKLCANLMAALIGLDPIYPGIKQPFSFMEKILMPIRADFFATQPSSYSKKDDTIHQGISNPVEMDF